MEPRTCEPVAAGTMPAPTAAPLPLDEPPGVRPTSQGLRAGPGVAKANSVVTVLPTIAAPALRSAYTQAASQPDDRPSKMGLPTCMGMSSVSKTSLMATGRPSSSESGRPSR